MERQPDFAAIILAGGKSSRLGRDKASESLLGRPMLQHVIDRVADLVDEIIVVAASGQRVPDLTAPRPPRVVRDAYPGCGPLAGIYSGLVASRAERCLAVACDMPLLVPRLIEALLARSRDCDALLPVLEYPEPLHAVYSRACIEPMRACIESGQLKITSFLGAVRPCYMHEDECRMFDPDLRSFVNTNTQADLDRARELLLAEQGVS